MKNNQKTNVRMTMIASILFVLISIFLVMMFTYEGQVKEFIYKTNPNTVNLIKVSI